MQKIKFGISISLSGRYSIQGKESFEGLALWVKDINNSGGIFVGEYEKKFPVELLYYDDESSADKCREIVERLINQDKIDVLIGPYSSGINLAASSIAEKYKKILWNHGGSSDEIFKQGFKYLVSAITPAAGYFTGGIDMVRKIDTEAKKIAILQAEDSGFSANVAKGARLYGEGTGFQVTEFKYPSGTKNFSWLLGELTDNSPDLILCVGRAEDDLLLAKQILLKKSRAKAVGLVVAGIKEFGEALGKNADGFLGPSQWEEGIKIEPDSGPYSTEFVDKFRKAYNKKPGYTAAQSYNIGLIIQKCIEDAGTLEDLVLREIASKLDFKTFYGHFKIDPLTGAQVGHKMVIVQWMGGKKLIVYPEYVAEANLVYPLRIPKI